MTKIFWCKNNNLKYESDEYSLINTYYLGFLCDFSINERPYEQIFHIGKSLTLSLVETQLMNNLLYDNNCCVFNLADHKGTLGATDVL